MKSKLGQSRWQRRQPSQISVTRASSFRTAAPSKKAGSDGLKARA
jgi:hypothetical protein